MNRLQQDAAEALKWHEHAEFRRSERARWAKAQGQPITGAWAPPALTAQQQHEFEQYRIAEGLPF